MKKILLTGMMLCLTASMALASGLNINWVTNTAGNCSATVMGNMTWDCVGPTANDGDLIFVVSVMPNVAVPGFNAIEFVIDGQSDTALPAWWQAYNAGSCREAAFAPGLPPATPTAPCAGTATTRLYQTGAFGGMGLWAIGPANRFRTVIGYATAANRTVPLITTTQYNAMNMHVFTTNSLDVAGDPGNGIDPIVACAGCTQPVTLVLQQIGLYGSDPLLGDTVILPIPTTGRQSINWQGGGGPPIPVSTRNTTWGQVKSLYR
jgi:hypothetical protein